MTHRSVHTLVAV